jgi:hypothetical protein
LAAEDPFAVDPRPFSPRGVALMLAKLQTFALRGIDAFAVEVDISSGLPKTVLLCPKRPVR